MEPRIVSLPAFTVVGVKYHGRNENNEIPQLWNDFGPRMDEIKHMVDTHACYGVCANQDKETHAFDYFAGFEVDSTDDIPEGMVSFEVPASTYAAFRTTLPAIGESFDHAYHTWLPPSGYRATGGPDLELYGEEFDPADPESTFEIFVPIVK
jgi:AraC family transcriptional regulator